MSDEIQNFDQLRMVIHISLRIEHPEWVDPNGNCPNCDDYVRRLGDLLEGTTVTWHELAGTDAPAAASSQEWHVGAVRPGASRTPLYAKNPRTLPGGHSIGANPGACFSSPAVDA